jgi:crotonobetaine/carnitine-CoA ligase
MPIADELREEEVLACVVVVEGVLADRALADGIFAHCRTQLAYYKAPGWIVFRETLPVTTTTKIQKGLIFGPGEDPRRVVGAYDLRHDKRRRDFGPAASRTSG